MGRIAQQRNDSYRAFEWFMESLNELNLEEANLTGSVNKYLVMDYLANATFMVSLICDFF